MLQPLQRLFTLIFLIIPLAGAPITPTPNSSTIIQGFGGAITALAWSPDGALLAASDGRFWEADTDVYLWERKTNSLTTLHGHSSAVHDLAWSPDGKLLASGSADETIRIWTRAGASVQTLDAKAGTVFKVAWSPDGATLATGSLYSPTQNTVKLWRVADWSLQATMTTDFSGGKFYNLGWSPDGKFLVAGATSYTEWHADGTPVFTYKSCASCAPAWGFAWSPDSSRWAIGNESSEVRMFATDGKEIATFYNSSNNVDVLAWSPDGQVLAGGSLSLWDSSGKLIDTRGAIGRIDKLVWSPDSKLLAGSSSATNAPTNKVFLWNRIDKTLVELQGHQGVVAALAWSPDGALLASGSYDKTVRLWSFGE